MSMHFPSTAVVEPPPKTTPNNKISGVCRGVLIRYLISVLGVYICTLLEYQSSLSIYTGSFQSLQQVMCTSLVQCPIVSSTVELHCSVQLSTYIFKSIFPYSLSSSPLLSVLLPFSSSFSSLSSPAGLSCTNVQLYSFGFIFSMVIFPLP